jgi:hypothetical protein
MKRLVAIAAGMLFALTGAVDAMAKGEGIEAALIRCVDVTYPAPLSLCGTDPLTTGKLEVKQTGEVEASVTGALPNATYDVLLGSIDGSSPISIAVMSTDGSGNGKVQASGAFDLDDEVALGTLTTNNKGKGQLRLENLVPDTTAGTGNVVLRRDATTSSSPVSRSSASGRRSSPRSTPGCCAARRSTRWPLSPAAAPTSSRRARCSSTRRAT